MNENLVELAQRFVHLSGGTVSLRQQSFARFRKSVGPVHCIRSIVGSIPCAAMSR